MDKVWKKVKVRLLGPTPKAMNKVENLFQIYFGFYNLDFGDRPAVCALPGFHVRGIRFDDFWRNLQFRLILRLLRDMNSTDLI
ncbi:hypothetical protein SUGI_0113890 [Cryptomeria japonica]|nr:hypothetical protein SUGI_0113890 [Cryptomeria japonica]